jgi:hypothetical protein
VIAHDGRLDDAGAFGVGAGGDRKRQVRRVQLVREVRGISRAGSLHPGNRVADERAEFLLGHS